jgi:hypothetical protein
VRLAVAAGRGGIAQLGLVTVGVAVGVSLLLLVLTVSPALQARQDRTAWHGTSAATAPARGAASGDGLWWLASQDHYRGRDVLRAAPSTGPPGR